MIIITVRIINRNPYLYGPGPVKRIPSGAGSYYGRLPPLHGFSMAAVHGVVIALVGSFIFKWGSVIHKLKPLKIIIKKIHHVKKYII
jgi:hypothetical protein